MQAQNLEQAIKGSDLYVKSNVVKGQPFLRFAVLTSCIVLQILQLKIGPCRLMRRAKWRQQPATEGQIKIVDSRWNKAPKYASGEGEDGAARSLRIQRLTKGEAANIITRLKHGAMVSITSSECFTMVLICCLRRVDINARWRQ